MTTEYREVALTNGGSGFECLTKTDGLSFEVRMRISFNLFLIRRAWERGCSYEDLADGFGPGGGTHGDWSALRDSTDEAKVRMLERALNFLFGEE